VTRWLNLKFGSVDMLSNWDTVTLERDISVPRANTGYTFTTPYVYAGMAFAGIPPFVGCADNNDITDACVCTEDDVSIGKGSKEVANITGTCKDLTICIKGGSTYVTIAEKPLS
jgi:hypothetical protein